MDSPEKIVIHADPDLIEIIPVFLKKREADIETIKKSIEIGDFKTIEVLGHQMKGAGSSYGFDAVSDIGGQLEASAKAGNKEEIIKQISDLQRYLDRVEVV